MLSSPTAMPQAWKIGDQHRQVAGVLVELLAARLAFLLQGLELGMAVDINWMMMLAEM